jgi:hypothetical protein
LIQRESESGFVRLVKRGFDLVFRQRRRETEKREREKGGSGSAEVRERIV